MPESQVPPRPPVDEDFDPLAWLTSQPPAPSMDIPRLTDPGAFADGDPNLSAQLMSAKHSRMLHLPLLRIVRVPTAVWDLTDLVRLDLGMNALRALPPQVSELTCLEQLWLNDNPLEGLPVELQHCKKLQVLDLRDTKVRDFPIELGRLKALTEVALDNTPFAQNHAGDPSALDTAQLVAALAVADKRELLRAELLEAVLGGLYREVADVAEDAETIHELVLAVVDAFADLDHLRNVIRNSDRLFPQPPLGAVRRRGVEAAAGKLRDKFETLQKDTKKKKLAAELELKVCVPGCRRRRPVAPSPSPPLQLTPPLF